MRRSKEVLFLLALLLLSMGAVLWYVIDRRRHPMPVAPVVRQETPPAGASPAGRNDPVDLTKHDGQTIDFSSGKPELRTSGQDQAALDAGLKDIEAAAAGVTFAREKKKPGPPATPPEKK